MQEALDFIPKIERKTRGEGWRKRGRKKEGWKKRKDDRKGAKMKEGEGSGKRKAGNQKACAVAVPVPFFKVGRL